MRNNNWTTSDSNSFRITNKIAEELPNAVFTIKEDMSGLSLVAHQNRNDDLFILNDSVSHEIINAIRLFWDRRVQFTSLNFLWKRGILLYGPPGSGKSSTIELLKKEFLENNGIAIYADYDMDLNVQALQDVRKVEPTRPILFIIEDIDRFTSYNNSKLLGLLDGEFQVSNIVIIATTNAIGSIPESIKYRPGRFDMVRYVGVPSREARELYLKNKVPNITKTNLAKFVKDSEGFYFSHLKELIVGVFALNIEYDQVISQLRSLIIHNENLYMENSGTDEDTPPISVPTKNGKTIGKCDAIAKPARQK